MRLIKPSFTIVEQQSGLDGLYKQIELAGRTCYKSEDRITENSAKEFVDRMIKSGHGAMLEHGTVYLKLEGINKSWEYYHAQEYLENNYSKVVIEQEGIDSADWCEFYITTNFRVLVENNWLNDLKYICEPTEYHEKRICVRFICDRGILAEFTRHRVFSFSAESSRYCNYSKDKFNNELTFIIPPFTDAIEGSYISGYDVLSANLKKPYGKGTMGGYFYESLRKAEESYMKLVTNQGIDSNIEVKLKPQEARAVLPNALKTELVMTGFVSDWKHFFELRCDSAAHPQAKELAVPLREEFIKRGYITE